MISGSLVPRFDHIVIVMMENKSDGDIVGNKDAGYINRLIGQSGVARDYYAVAHPSLPNYLALIGGSTFGVNNDCTGCFQAADSLIDKIEESGRSWKAYMESMPEPCFVGSSGRYVQKHDPFIYFDSIRNDEKRCNRIVPYSQLGTDLALRGTTPDFVWISPNSCHDMHDCSVEVGDNWLSVEVPNILKSKAFAAQNSLLVILWDEADNKNSNRVPIFLFGRAVKAGYASDVRYDHYSLLRTIEIAWGLSPLTKNDRNASTMQEFFK
ncbi:MAG: alkaline phosphatase family protein [Deltaproteobacteria bacterium]|nr:alkaline phosphatase family protein [Deltaproteobacteria bacterium]